MNAMVVFESCWGNTRRIAEVIGAELGADVAVSHVDEAPDQLPDDLDLLVLGAPTHAFTLSTPQSRAEAVKFGGEVSRRGIREWAAQLSVPASQPLVALFDTRQGKSVFVGSAAKSASKLLRAQRLHPRGIAHFVVTGREGPLANGEVERAAAWAHMLREPRS